VQKSLEAAEAVASPRGFAEKFKSYATTTDPELQSLYKRVEAGDYKATLQLTQKMSDMELGPSELLERVLLALS
jgi:hypothetical protein